MSTISEFCMPRVLRDWARRRATGTLTVTAAPPADALATVLVENGAVVFATRRAKSDPTGELFLELFHVPDIGGDDADEIARIENQVTRVVADLFNWPVAAITYQDGIKMTRWPRLDLPVPDLILRGMRVAADTERVAGWIGGSDGRFVRTGDPFSLFREPLAADETDLLARFDTPIRASDAIAGTLLDFNRAIRLVAAFCFAGALELVSEPVSQKPPTRPEPKIDVAEAARFWYMVEEKMRAVDGSADYYALLGVERRASVEAIGVRYRELTREFHPDRYRHFSPNHVDVDKRLDKIFEALTTAHTVLSNPKHREIYDRDLAKREQRTAIRVAAPSIVRPIQIPVFVPPPEQARPPHNAPPPPPRNASPSEPGPARERQAPSSQTASPRANSSVRFPTMSLSADDWFERGKGFTAAGDHARASQAYERAVKLAPDNVHFVIAYGLALAKLPTQVARAEETLRSAIKLQPFSIKPLVALARFYRETGRFDEARTVLSQAEALKPGAKALQDEKADLDRAAKANGSGLLRRILGS